MQETKSTDTEIWHWVCVLSPDKAKFYAFFRWYQMSIYHDKNIYLHFNKNPSDMY